MERHPALANWVDDDRIYDIPETLLGPDFFLLHTAGVVYRGDTPWHGGFSPETPQSYKPFANAKIAMYFDSLSKDDGCLRVIPGTHRRPFADRVRPLQHEADKPQSMSFGVVDKGVPSAYGSKIGRLQINVEYGGNPTTDEQIAELCERHDSYRWSFHPSQSYIDSDRPRIRRMVSRLVVRYFPDGIQCFHKHTILRQSRL